MASGQTSYYSPLPQQVRENTAGRPAISGAKSVETGLILGFLKAIDIT